MGVKKIKKETKPKEEVVTKRNIYIMTHFLDRLGKRYGDWKPTSGNQSTLSQLLFPFRIPLLCDSQVTKFSKYPLSV